MAPSSLSDAAAREIFEAACSPADQNPGQGAPLLAYADLLLVFASLAPTIDRDALVACFDALDADLDGALAPEQVWDMLAPLLAGRVPEKRELVVHASLVAVHHWARVRAARRAVVTRGEFVDRVLGDDVLAQVLA